MRPTEGEHLTVSMRVPSARGVGSSPARAVRMMAAVSVQLGAISEDQQHAGEGHVEAMSRVFEA